MSNISTTPSTYTTGGIDTRTNLDGTSLATFQQMNGAASGVVAIETILGDGTNLRGSKADLVARLAIALAADGTIKANTSAVFSGLTDKYGLIGNIVGGLIPKNIAPIGMLTPWPTVNAPTHWFLCNGQAISRTTYVDLFTVIGETYGIGDGSNTFNLPDLRGRTIIMIDGAANRITASSTNGGNADTLGGVGGAETHTLQTTEIPSHTHTAGTAANIVITGGGADMRDTSAGNVATGGAGGGGAHSNTQPWIALNYIIYAGA